MAHSRDFSRELVGRIKYNVFYNGVSCLVDEQIRMWGTLYFIKLETNICSIDPCKYKLHMVYYNIWRKIFVI